MRQTLSISENAKGLLKDSVKNNVRDSVKEKTMLDKTRNYTLRSGDSHAHVIIKHCGTIEVHIPEENKHLTSELEKVHFKLNEEGVLLICNDKGCSIIEDVSLKLSRRDTFDLYEIVNEVLEEYERLMSDL